MKCCLFIILLSVFQDIKAQNDSAHISAEDSTVIGFAVNELYQKLPEGPLGNFIADGIKTAVQIKWGNKIDVALASPQSIKGKIENGTFRKNRLLKLLPYEDSIAILKVNGTRLTEMLHKIASLGGFAVSGIQMQINNMRADSIFVNREPLDSIKEYMLAMPYYLILKKKIPVAENTPFFNANLPVRLAICEYIRWLTNRGKTISPIPYRRIKYAN